MKIVINNCYGGFNLSEVALLEYNKRTGSHIVNAKEINRDDKDLISVVEMLGENANKLFTRLKIVEIPDGIDWEISEYDGMEAVVEKHRHWR